VVFSGRKTCGLRRKRDVRNPRGTCGGWEPFFQALLFGVAARCRRWFCGSVAAPKSLWASPQLQSLNQHFSILLLVGATLQGKARKEVARMEEGALVGFLAIYFASITLIIGLLLVRGKRR
jgi:hypothetical protein